MLFLIPVALLFVFVLLHLVLRPRRADRPFIIAHRGAAGLAPENTLQAVHEAIRLGVAYTEIDIRRSSDGALVVMHDRSLSRTTGEDANVEDRTAAEIVRLRVRQAGSQELSTETVPTLDAVLQQVVASEIRLVIEVKDPSLYPGIAEQLAEAIHRAGAGSRVVVGSFDHAWLPEFRAAGPDLPIVPIADWYTPMPRIPDLQFVDVDWPRVLLDPTFVRRMRAQRRRVLVWTVDRPFVMRLMDWLGVDGITTNRPDVCQHALGS